MHSKILPWDFVSKFPQTINSAKTGVYAFLSSDPYIEHILSKNLPRKNLSFRCYTGLDITKDYIEEHFCNLSFFSQTENIFIMSAELISAQNYALLLEKIPEITNQYIVLFFSKTNKLFLELQKIASVESFTIEAPRFWEGPKMLQFAAKEKKVNLNPVGTKFILENLEHNFESFFKALDKIQLADVSIPLTEEILKEIITRERFDFFEMVDLYYQNPKKLFTIMLTNELDYEWLRSLAAFMQGHLIKLLYPSEIKAKDKLSKYDQAILFHSEKLNHSFLQNDLRFFSDLEILAKGRDQLIIDHLRLKIISDY